MKVRFGSVFIVLALWLVSCGDGGSIGGGGGGEPPPLPEHIRVMSKTSSGGGYNISLNLTGTQAGEKYYVVKVNKKFPSAVPNASMAISESPSTQGIRTVPQGEAVDGNGNTFTVLSRVFPDLPKGVQFANSGAGALRAVRSVYTTASVGTQKTFYVIKNDASATKAATLRAIGTYCKIWVADVNWTASTADASHVNQAGVDALKTKFDALYPIETALLGYEYGGGAGGNGGADGDSKIQILLEDIDDDSNTGSNGYALGYFYTVDEITDAAAQSANSAMHSNEAEIFYLDVIALLSNPDNIYSTLVHEFNHMINFHEKTIKNGVDYKTWFTEMLSVLAEDCIAPMIGIGLNNNAHTMQRNIGYWLNTPNLNWIQWLDAYPYAAAYAFGAYICRNYGGPALLRRMATSRYYGRDAIEDAIKGINGSSYTLDYVLARFSEAFVYVHVGAIPTGLTGYAAFDKSASSNIGDRTYSFPAFGLTGSAINVQTSKVSTPVSNWAGNVVGVYTASGGSLSISFQVTGLNDGEEFYAIRAK